MATQKKVSKDSQYCRDCGGRTTLVAEINEVWCWNTSPQLVCANLPRENRNYCEQCGCSNPGPHRCPHCQCTPL